MQTINPAVYAEASLFTDGAITDAVLANVAAMRGLPLYVETPAPQPPSPLELAHVAVARAEVIAERKRVAYVVARARITAANKAAGRNPSPFMRALARDQRREAFRAFNRARVAVRIAERELINARVALDCARIAALPSLAIAAE